MTKYFESWAALKAALDAPRNADGTVKTSPVRLMTPAKIEAMMAEAGRQAARESRRAKAAKYTRKASTLVSWMFSGRKNVVLDVVIFPESPVAVKALCHALWDDYTTALKLPKFYRRRQVRIDVLRELFTCECEQYRRMVKP